MGRSGAGGRTECRRRPLQSDPRVPLHVDCDSGQGEGAAFVTWERARRGGFVLQGYQAGRLHLCCHFCEAVFNVPHSPEDKRPFSVRHGDRGALLVECVACRAGRGVEPLAVEAG